MQCTRCEASLSPLERFCGQCGEPCQAPSESPGAQASYREAMATFLSDGALPDWAEQELSVLRGELGIHPATHQRLLAELQPRPAAPPPVSLHLDAASMRHFTAGAQCLLRLRVCNEGQRALKAVRLECASSALAQPAERSSKALGPGLSDELSITLQPSLAGQHQLHVLLTTIDMRGEEISLRSSAASFAVARGDAGPSTVVTQIDASSMRVGTFDNLRIGASPEPAGGLLAEHEWRPLSLSVVGASAVAALRRELGLISAVRAAVARPASPAAPRAGRSVDAGRRKVDLWNELLDIQGRLASAGSRRGPEVAELHHRCGQLHEALGNRDQALGEYEKASSIAPTLVASSRDLALCLLRKGDLPRAEKALRALLLLPLDADSGISKADIHCHLADVLLRQGDKARAHEMVLLALEADPTHAQARKLREQISGRSSR